MLRAVTDRTTEGPESAGARPHLADPRRGGCEPQPVGRERRAARHRRGVRRLQMTLNLIAVGYSLGLAASVLYLGAIGDRYGRKMMLVLGTGARHPDVACSRRSRRPTRCCSSRASAAGSRRAWRTRRRSHSSRRCGREPARTRSIALWSALGGAIAALGPLMSGRAARAVRLGIGVPRDAAAGGARARSRVPVRAEPRQRDAGARGQPRRHPVRRCSSERSSSGSTSRRCRTRDARRSGSRRSRSRRRRLLPPPAPCGEPALRPARRRAAASSGSRRARGSSSSAR